MSGDFISAQCLQNILSPEVKFHFCQNDRNETTPAMSLISGYLM